MNGDRLPPDHPTAATVRALTDEIAAHQATAAQLEELRAGHVAALLEVYSPASVARVCGMPRERMYDRAIGAARAARSTTL